MSRRMTFEHSAGISTLIFNYHFRAITTKTATLWPILLPLLDSFLLQMSSSLDTRFGQNFFGLKKEAHAGIEKELISLEAYNS